MECSRKLTFKNYEERRSTAEKICDEAHLIKDQFVDMCPRLVSPELNVMMKLQLLFILLGFHVQWKPDITGMVGPEQKACYSRSLLYPKSLRPTNRQCVNDEG